MENELKSKLHQKLETMLREGVLSLKVKQNLEKFFLSYEHTLASHGMSVWDQPDLFFDFLDRVAEQEKSPYQFQPYHEHIRSPFDYYQFGIDFMLPLVDQKRSTISGLEQVQEIVSLLEHKENVILLANHQTEADPQAISLLLDPTFPSFAEEMIFVAGERVTTDPLAIPFSMGRNLLCIYSKRYIDFPPELKHQKQMHNKRTMELMSNLLSEGGKSIYVAPSGGRDRPNSQGIVEVAPFDAQSIEMFYLMTKKATRPTHFFPLALATFDLIPPPETIQIELGEHRKAKRGAIHLAFGPKIDMDHYPGCEDPDKHLRRKARADYIWNLVKDLYQKFPR